MFGASVVVTVSAHSWLKKLVAPFLSVGILVLVFLLPYFISRNNDCAISLPLSEAPGFRVCVNLEVANTKASRVIGLSGRKSMPKNSGMLFVFDNTGRQCMWMKDMNIDLDIIWVDQNGDITHVEKGISPTTFPKTYCGGKRDKYVIELNAGMATDANLVVGRNLRLQ